MLYASKEEGWLSALTTKQSTSVSARALWILRFIEQETIHAGHGDAHFSIPVFKRLSWEVSLGNILRQLPPSKEIGIRNSGKVYQRPPTLRNTEPFAF